MPPRPRGSTRSLGSHGPPPAPLHEHARHADERRQDAVNVAIGAIGRAVGWPEPAVFSRQFRKAFGVSPRENCASHVPLTPALGCCCAATRTPWTERRLARRPRQGTCEASPRRQMCSRAGGRGAFVSGRHSDGGVRRSAAPDPGAGTHRIRRSARVMCGTEDAGADEAVNHLRPVLNGRPKTCLNRAVRPEAARRAKFRAPRSGRPPAPASAGLRRSIDRVVGVAYGARTRNLRSHNPMLCH